MWLAIFLSLEQKRFIHIIQVSHDQNTGFVFELFHHACLQCGWITCCAASIRNVPPNVTANWIAIVTMRWLTPILGYLTMQHYFSALLLLPYVPYE